MPPVTKAGGTQFRKDVEFVTKEDDEQVAAGIVMVPDKADLQQDFARAETIRGFSDQFETFVDAGEAGGGIMHAVFPDGWMDLERNEVLNESEEIGGKTVDAGAWVQEWAIDNADLWSLIDDDILAGYSIGAVQVDWDGPYEPDEVDDVEIPDDLGDDPLVWELTDGLIREVSAVDIPAVPDAQILEAKADADKRLGDYLGDRDGFVEEALERGHSESEAERLWDVLTAATEAAGSDQPGKQSLLARAGKAFLSALSGDADVGGPSVAETPDADPRKTADADAAKEGRTLSTANQHSLFATIDAAADVLEDAGVDHGIQRFTDREDTDFDLSEHSARDWPKPDDEDEDDVPDVSITDNAAGGETPDDTDTDTTMSDDNPDDPMADAPEWAKALTDRIDDLENEKAGGEEPGEPLEDAPEWAKDIASRVDEIEEKALGDDTEEDKPEWAKNLENRIDAISKQTGATESQQLGGAEKGGDDEGEIGDRQKYFIPQSKRGGI